MPVHQYNSVSMYGTETMKATGPPVVGFEINVSVVDTEDDAICWCFRENLKDVPSFGDRR